MDPLTSQDLIALAALAAVTLGVGVLLFTLIAARRTRPAHPAVDADQARLLSEIRELTDRLAGELDAKSARLEKLLAEASRVTQQLDGARAAATTRAPEPSAAPPVTELKPGPDASARRPRHGPEPLHQTVHELADAGLTPVQIAERTSLPTGQVELILALRRAAAAR
jgi:hypothetical protein